MVKLYIKRKPEDPDDQDLVFLYTKDSKNDSIQQIVTELSEDIGFSLPPAQLIVRIGKREWYQITNVKEFEW